MPRVIHFEIQADDPERAAAFYKNVFGWSINKWDGPMDYWMIMTGPKETPGIDGGLYKRPKPTKTKDVIAFICTVDVPDVDAYVKKVEKQGGTIIQSKNAIPGVGWFAQCQDTEGNVFGLIQNDTNAE